VKRIVFGLALAFGLSSLACSGGWLPGAAAQKGSSSGPTFSGGSRPSGSSGPTFSGGSRPSSSSGPTFSGGGSKPSGGSSGPTFSGGGSKPSGGSSGPTFSGGGSKSEGSRPSGNGYDGKAAADQARAESRQQMRQSQAPKTEYKTPAGQTRNIDPKDQKIEQLRRDLDREKYANRQLRQDNLYAHYAGRPPMVYNDPYGPLFMYVLLDRSLDERAMWAYHHRESMDDARYQELLRRDAQLSAKIKELEAKGVQRDPTYTLPGVDPDLQYDDEYVEAAYNGEKEQTDYAWLGWLCLGVVVFVGVVFVVYFLVFVKKWEG
jgi:hypothetical protein